MADTLLVDRSVLVLKVAHMGDYTLKRELREALSAREVAEFQQSHNLAYWQAYFEVLAGEIGARGISQVERALPQGGYRLNAQELKGKVELAEYIGRYTMLHKIGIDRLVGLCPLHGDTHPSLFVYEARGDWYCFGCLKGGDIINFIEHAHGVGFYEALTILSQEVAGCGK